MWFSRTSAADAGATVEISLKLHRRPIHGFNRKIVNTLDALYHKHGILRCCATDRKKDKSYAGFVALAFAKKR